MLTPASDDGQGAYTLLNKDLAAGDDRGAAPAPSRGGSRTRRSRLRLLTAFVCSAAALAVACHQPRVSSVLDTLGSYGRRPTWPSYLDADRLARIDERCRAAALGPTPPTSDMSIAHLVSAHHDESIVSMAMMLQEMYDPLDLFVVHVKRGVESAHLDTLERAFGSCANVVFVPDEERIESGYGVWSVVEMELVMMRVALRHSMQWAYAILMDGASWPTMPTEERREWFRNRPANTSQTFLRLPDSKELFAICPGNMCGRSPSRCVDDSCTTWTMTPGGMPIARASQFNRFTRELAHWITSAPELKPWEDFFRMHVAAPEEHYFATVHWVSPFRDQDDGELYVYTDWENSQHCLWWPNPRPVQSPCYLSVMDIPNVVGSGMPFMRKISSGDANIRRAMPMSRKLPAGGMPIWQGP